jgi:hypothetical protein
VIGLQRFTPFVAADADSTKESTPKPTSARLPAIAAVVTATPPSTTFHDTVKVASA